MAVGAAAAPLNPSLRRTELTAQLSALRARALLLAPATRSPAGEAAAALGIPVIEIEVHPSEPAGRFRIASAGPPARAPGAPGPAGPEDEALLLPTSGTTSRPKLVPLSQRNLWTSARGVARTLRLCEADRCLVVMPLFHVHGLVGALLATLAAGGSAFCAPGFDALRFFGWLGAARPTWYTAVPALHQAVLARAGRNRDAARAARLRFVRSCSSALPRPVLHALEAAFDAPVIEAYGMTEAAHQISSNPLPPGRRVPGSVGVATGPQVALVDDEGKLLPGGASGEIAVRGDSVMRGYDGDPHDDGGAFVRGWLRTGDQGSLDADGYLRITGRLKEMINRAGEKIAPREVDEVLLEHPDVRAAIAFALPHPRLEEEVAAAVVLNPAARADARALRRFAATRLADHKVPRRIVFLEQLPLGASGKPLRVGLAKHLGLA